MEKKIIESTSSPQTIIHFNATSNKYMTLLFKLKTSYRVQKIKKIICKISVNR